jgi:nucleoside-diphosphate-sugar epimerase
VVADEFTRVTGRRLPINRKLAQQLLVPGWTCSTRKAAKKLGFEPRVPMRESIARAGGWYRAHGWL